MIKAYIEKEKNRIKEISSIRKDLVLNIITDDVDERTKTYMKSKIKLGEELGIKVNKIVVKDKEELKKVLSKIKEKDEASICQLPIKKELEELYNDSLCNSDNDVDGFFSFENIYKGNLELTPCTAKGVMRFLESIVENIQNKNIVIFGRGELTGLPLMNLAVKRFGTVSMITSKTSKETKDNLIKNGDVFVLSSGVKGSLKLSEVPNDKKTIIIINIGTVFENGKLTTELDLDCEEKENVYYTPRIGGVGVLTVLNLFDNVIERKIKKEKK